MSEEAFNKLQKVVFDHGLERLEDVIRWRGLLSDYFCGEHRRELRALVFAVELRCVERLQSERSTVDAILLPQLAQRLHDEMGLDVTLAAWAVKCWAAVVGRSPSSNTKPPSRGLSAAALGDGYYAEQNYEEAVKLYRASAKQGNSHAQCRLGDCYFTGEGVTHNFEEAYEWYSASAYRGNAVGQFKLGDCCYYGKGVEQNYERAFKWYRASAEQGNRDGQLKLGICYYDGKGVEENYEEAAKWFRASAEQGNSDGQCWLGTCYYEGTGVEQNYEEAVKWFRASAEQGNSDGQRRLGDCYSAGEGVAQNVEEADKWHRASAEQDNSVLKDMFGDIYSTGEDVINHPPMSNIATLPPDEIAFLQARKEPLPPRLQELLESNLERLQKEQRPEKALPSGNPWDNYIREEGEDEPPISFVLPSPSGSSPTKRKQAAKTQPEMTPMPVTPDKSYLEALALRAKVFNELHPGGHGANPEIEESIIQEFDKKGYVILYKNGEAFGAIVHTNPSEIARGSKAIRIVDFTADPILIPGVPSTVEPNDTLLLALRAEKEKLSPRGLAALERMEEQAKHNSQIPHDPNAQFALGDCYYAGRGVKQNYGEAAKWFRASAEQGNAVGQCKLGACYYAGKGVEQNYEEAVKWYRASAEQGNSDAQYGLGDCYYDGTGFEQNYEEAAKWFRASAEQGNAVGQLQLGICYYAGEGVEQNYEEAVKCLRASAELGDSDGQCRLGTCYYAGKGVNQNYKEAVKWFRASAEQGNADAQWRLGDCYYAGKGVKQNYRDAVKWFRASAEQGNAVGQLQLGSRYYAGKGVEQNYKEAVKWYHASAEQGNSDAQWRLGDCYYAGKGVKQSEEEAAKWFRASAEQGNSDAQCRLGTWYYDCVEEICHIDGIYDDPNYEEAAKWFRASAEQWNADAQWRLGMCYYAGDGVEQNYEDAVKWFRASAEQGNSNGQRRLGDCYYAGNGVEQNYEEAVKWYRASAEQGNSKAQELLGDCYFTGEGVKHNKEEADKWHRVSSAMRLSGRDTPSFIATVKDRRGWNGLSCRLFTNLNMLYFPNCQVAISRPGSLDNVVMGNFMSAMWLSTEYRATLKFQCCTDSKTFEALRRCICLIFRRSDKLGYSETYDECSKMLRDCKDKGYEHLLQELSKVTQLEGRTPILHYIPREL